MNYRFGLVSVSFRKHTQEEILAAMKASGLEFIEWGSELYTLENCILTPHIAGSIGGEVRRMGEYMEKEYQCFTHGKPCKYEVTQKMLETMA